MRQLKITLLLILISCSYCSSNQEKTKIREIKLSTKHSMMIPNNIVNITLKNHPRSKDRVDVEVISKPMYDTTEWEHTRIDTVFIIPKATFFKISKEIMNIKQSDLYENIDVMGVDGYTTQLEFGNSFNSISYKVFGPGYNTKERKLENYLKVCELIIESANLKVEDVLVN